MKLFVSDGDFVCIFLVIENKVKVNFYVFGFIGFSDIYVVVVILVEEIYWGKFLIDGVGFEV